MRKFLTALFCLGFMAAPAAASACMPPPDYIERWQEYEKQDLLRATVLFRGVIEDLYEDRYGDVTMVIRRTQSFWGHSVPERIVVPREYFSNCARGNLHAAVDGRGKFPGLPVVTNGLGVTLLGRAEDAAEPWHFTILVDNAQDTQRVLHRFKELRSGR